MFKYLKNIYILKGKRNAYSLWIIFVSKIYCSCKWTCVWNVKYSISEQIVIHYIANRPNVCRVWMVKATEVKQERCKPLCNNRKNWFFKCHSFWQFGINWKLLNVNINMAHENYAYVSFKFMYLLIRLLMLLPAQHLLPLYWSPRRVNRKSEFISIIV